MRFRCVAFLATVAVAGGTSALATPDVLSDFSIGKDGWTTASVNPVTYVPNAVGNPSIVGGRLHATEIPDGIFVFVAPPKFRGDLTPYVGGRVTYSLADETHNVDPYVNLILHGANGLAIAYPTLAPTTTGRDYTIPLSSGGWVTGPSFTPINDAQFQSVISNVQDFAINGDWTGDLGNGNFHTDVLDLGSVRMAAPVPEPSAFAALGLGALAFLRRRRRATP